MSEEKMYPIKKIREYVSRKINALSAHIETSGGKAQLAKLRQGAGKYPGENPELWGAFLNELPEELLSRNREPSYAEWAIYLSLTMYAVHQQGKSESVHAEKISLGHAASQLIEKDKDENDERERILRRFGPVITAKDMNGFSYHLRCFVKLFSSKNIKLDYVKLAENIYNFQFEDSRRKVQLSWGEDFYYNKGE